MNTHTRIHTQSHTRCTRALTDPHGCHIRRQACLPPSHAHSLGDPCRVVPGRSSSRMLSLIVPRKVTVARPPQAPQCQFLSSDTLQAPLQVLLIMAMVMTLARGPALRKNEVSFIPGPALHTLIPAPITSCLQTDPSLPNLSQCCSLYQERPLHFTSSRSSSLLQGKLPAPLQEALLLQPAQRLLPLFSSFPNPPPLPPHPAPPLPSSSLVPHTWALTRGSEQALP